MTSTTIQTLRGVREIQPSDLNRAIHTFIAELPLLDPLTVRYPAVKILKSRRGFFAQELGEYVGIKTSQPLTTGRFSPPKDYMDAPAKLLALCSGSADISGWRDSELIELVVQAANQMPDAQAADCHSLTLTLQMLLAAVHGTTYNALAPNTNLIPKKETA